MRNGTLIAEPRSFLRQSDQAAGASRCRRKFTCFFPDAFHDEKYDAWERGYKQAAHDQWTQALGKQSYARLLRAGKHMEIAQTAVRVESRTNLLFSFEKMALRDAVKAPLGARLFATALYEYLYGRGKSENRFNAWIDAVAAFPRRQTRVLTWPIVTVFGFIARPDVHIFLKPNVTREAARQYGFDFHYVSRPSWPTYTSLLEFATQVHRDLADLHPRDMIDIQSFLWVQGSDEYAD